MEPLKDDQPIDSTIDITSSPRSLPPTPSIPLSDSQRHLATPLTQLASPPINQLGLSLKPSTFSPPSSPSRHLPLFSPSSPLSSAGSLSRGRQGSTSSNVSTAGTDPTSLDESGEESIEGEREKEKEKEKEIVNITPTPLAGGPPLSGAGSSSGRRASSQPDLFYASSSSTPQSTSSLSSSSNLGSSIPISITTSIQPASVRLSTTPHFPSPLAQATTGPEEDTEQTKAEDGDGESEDEGQDTSWDIRNGSPLARALDVSSSGLFGEMDMSPTLGTIGLPDVSALGFESSRTPRPPPRASHQRTLSGRDSSPDVEANRTARGLRVRSVGRASGLALAASRASEDAGQARRRSRTAEFSSQSPVLGSGGPSPFVYPASANRPQITPLVTGSPPGATAWTNSISRRASINLASPPRSFAPPSPSTSRAPRTSLSAALISPVPIPFPAPPPPVESIKLQKVPESVRSAVDFRHPTGLNFLGDAVGSIPGSGFAGPTEMKVPKTPAATRAPSPASASGSASDTVRSQPPSQESSRGPSRVPSRGSSRRGSVERSSVPPLPSPSRSIPDLPVPSTSSQPTSDWSSATAFPSAPPPPSTRRDRSKSVYISPTAAIAISSNLPVTSGSGPAHDLGVSPLTSGLAPFASQRTSSPAQLSATSQGLPTFSYATNSTSVSSRNQGQSRLSAHRTSVAPTDVNSPMSENTDEYAQIILASRSAKMRKWKTSTLSTASLALDLSGLSKDSFSRRPLPTFLDQEGMTVEEADIADETGAFGGTGSNKEIEWVDWLDEYRKMKEAKLEAEQALLSDMSVASVPNFLELVKGKEKTTVAEYNPYEATTADLIQRRTTGFLTPDPPVQYFPVLPTSAVPAVQPKTTPIPISPSPDCLEPTVSNTPSSASMAASPGAKRKKNFKLGSKIDAWWSAVRTSFLAGPESDRGERSRRTSDTPAGLNFPAAVAASRTSSQFARPHTPGETPALRNVASAHDLSHSRDNSPGSDVPRRPVPAGALAPAARLGATLHPPSNRAGGRSSGSDSDTATTKVDSRWRNPHLSLNLGPSFNSMTSPPVNRRPAFPPRNSSDTTSSVSDVSPLPAGSRPGLSSKLKNQPLASGLPASTPGLTPGHAPMWDRTPGLLPTSESMANRGASALAPAHPNAIKDAKAGVNTSFSMHTVRQQIRLRLATAKDNCDKELKKVVQGITAHVEMELHNQLQVGGFEDGRYGDFAADAEGPEGLYPLADPDSESEALADTDGGYDTGHTDSDGGVRPAMRQRGLSSGPRVSSAQSARRQSVSARLQSEHPRRQSLAPRMRSLASTSSSNGEKKSLPGSTSSSRSTSRSRSPLPPKIRNMSVGSRSPAQSNQSLHGGVDLAESSLIVLLQDIITVATEILDTTISKLTSRSGTCAEYIQRVQQIGKAWEENPDLPLRGWYVQLLLAVAGLSRVVEWWEAERGFWTFDDADEEDAEPILFVAKPTTAESAEPYRTAGGSFPPLEPPSAQYSPLGIDLGVSYDDAETTEGAGELSSAAHEEAAKRDADDLRQAVEQVRSQTLLMELTLDGQLFQYLSSAWRDLAGLDPEECLDTPIAEFLFPDDAAVFAEATRQLEADDSHTVEVSFRLRVGSASSSSQDDSAPEDLYDIMEGKGMLMIDGVSGGPSHTMWVIRPAPYSPGTGSPAGGVLPSLQRRFTSDRNISFSPLPRLLPTEPVLCRICERPTPAWFFEKHNETCNETHRLESDISECNDRLKELGHVVDNLTISLDEVEALEPLEYRGIPLLVPPPIPTPPTYLEALRPPLSTRPQSLQIRKTQRRILEQVSDIVRTALDIATPTVLDETGDIPIQDQRLLSPNSENKLAIVMRWQRPVAEESALTRLIADTEEQTRFKLNSVNRLRNTILYAEKVRQEWEAKALALGTDHSSAAGGGLFDSPQLQPIDFQDSNNRSLEPLDLSTSLQRSTSSRLDISSPRMSPDNPALVLSPRIPSGVPSSRTKASSIKDYTILKPISKGAFGSVYLARKVTTGDYYAIKVLKKSDMIAKNQVTNVKAERMILMTQTESDFVVKLFYTFQSRDYLYLVMEYLNGGDCAALIKNMGELPEEWARKYIAEVVVGLEYLHASGIVHRDLKPDNLLIDTYGHLKLTDFGLSRIGLLGRQTRMPASREQQRRTFDNSSRSTSKENTETSTTSSPSSTPANALGASYFGSLGADNFWLDTPASESSGSGSLGVSTKGNETPNKPAVSQVSQVSQVSNPLEGGLVPQKHFVGTPDYLAPESILGLGMDARVDWWALGVICYEFLYGFPPFHDETPEKVFENILSRRIEWHEGEIDTSPAARDFMDQLLCSDVNRRLGAEGASQVKSHPWLAGIDWENLLAGDVDFIPKISDPESTDYFDPRGATTQGFDDDEPPAETLTAIPPSPDFVPRSFATDLTYRRLPRERSETEPSPQEDFGTFTFRNLPVLKQANDDVIRQMKDQQLLPPLTIPPDSPSGGNRPLPQSSRSRSRPGSIDFRTSFQSPNSVQSGPSSPSTSSSSSNPSRPTAPSSPYSLPANHSRRPSDQHAVVDRLRTRQSSLTITAAGSEHARRNSLPSRLRKYSLSEYDRPSMAEAYNTLRRTSAQTPLGSQLSSPNEDFETPSAPASTISASPSSALGLTHPIMHHASSAPPAAAPISTSMAAPATRTNTIDCLIAGRNPISNKVLETILVRLGCRCVVVPNGAEAILAAQGVKFDIIWMDVYMDIVDGEKAARMIKSTNNPSSSCPIIAVCSFGIGVDDEVGTLFSGTLPKPINRDQVLQVFRQKLSFNIERRRGSNDNEERRGSVDP